MKLIELLKDCRVENLDTNELLYDGEEQELFMHNIKKQFVDNDYAKLCDIEATEDFIEKLKANDTGDYLDDSINQTILNAAWLTYRGLAYDELEDVGDPNDLIDDCYRYEICLGNWGYEYECDVDLV